MSYNVKQEKQGVGKSSGWDRMIADAKKRIATLQSSIRVFEKKKALGETWPGTTEHAATQN